MGKTTIFLGAGFSKSAGIPLTSELFDEIPYSPNDNSIKYKLVVDAWEKSGQKNIESWLKEKYYNKDEGVDFQDIVDFILARVVRIPKKYGKNGAYYYGISTSIPEIAHREFWYKIRNKFEINAIITTNFDIIIEQGLRNVYSDTSNERHAPLCKYGGFPSSFEQKIKIITNVATGNKPATFREEIMEGIELYKLHGSLNWVEEPHALKIHDDVRAVFRKKRGPWKPLIIPPLEEKDRPVWAYETWNYSEKRLMESDTWFICGYSFPEYDESVCNLFSRASMGKGNLKVLISDPNSAVIIKRLKTILKCKNEIIPLDGLPKLLKSL
jgi:hypothetical protein